MKYSKMSIHPYEVFKGEYPPNDIPHEVLKGEYPTDGIPHEMLKLIIPKILKGNHSKDQILVMNDHKKYKLNSTVENYMGNNPEIYFRN